MIRRLVVSLGISVLAGVVLASAAGAAASQESGAGYQSGTRTGQHACQAENDPEQMRFGWENAGAGQVGGAGSGQGDGVCDQDCDQDCAQDPARDRDQSRDQDQDRVQARDRDGDCQPAAVGSQTQTQTQTSQQTASGDQQQIRKQDGTRALDGSGAGSPATQTRGRSRAGQ